MGYFSNLESSYFPYERDCSITPPEQILLWRLEMLEDRLGVLKRRERTRTENITCPEEDLRYALPENLETTADVRAAMELVMDELEEKYGIVLREKDPESVPVMDELTGMQISFLELLPACRVA